MIDNEQKDEIDKKVEKEKERSNDPKMNKWNLKDRRPKTHVNNNQLAEDSC